MMTTKRAEWLRDTANPSKPIDQRDAFTADERETPMAHNLIRRALAISFSLALLGTSAIGQGIVSTTGGAFEPATLPANLFRNDPNIESDSDSFVFLEQGGFTQASPLRVDDLMSQFSSGVPIRLGPGGMLLNGSGNGSPYFLPGGETFDVYMFSFDRKTELSGGVVTTSVGTVTFQEEIVALQYQTDSLKGTPTEFGGDLVVGHSMISYPGHDEPGGALGDDPNLGQNPHQSRGLESNTNDLVVISADRRTIEFEFVVGARPDQLRVITRPYTDFAIEYFCEGSMNCPCGNDSPTVGPGCLNSSMQGALLTAFNQPVLAEPNTFRLEMSGMTSNRFCVLFMGSGTEPSPMAFGDGLRCVAPGPVGGSFLRSEVRNSGPMGMASWDNVVTNFSMTNSIPNLINAGIPVGFQGYYRDPFAGNCSAGQGFNLSNAVRVTFQ